MGYKLALIAAGLVTVAGIGLLPQVFDHPTAHEAIARPTVPLIIPPGQRLITVHGLTVSVPASWRQVIGHPCVLHTSLVMLPATANPDCAAGRAKGVSTIEFFEGQLATSRVAPAATDIRIDGVPGTRTSFTDIRSSYLVIGVPSRQVSVEIGAPTAAEADRLAATLRITAGDAHGCPTQAPTGHRLTRLGATDRAGADRMLLPTGASRVILCRYLNGWLEQGVDVPAAKLASVVADLDALPAGLSRASDACRSEGRDQPGLTQDGAGYLVFADYPSGPGVTVAVRLALCGDLGASNGSRTAQRTGELISLVTGLVGDAQGYPQQVTPA